MVLRRERSGKLSDVRWGEGGVGKSVNEECHNFYPGPNTVYSDKWDKVAGTCSTSLFQWLFRLREQSIANTELLPNIHIFQHLKNVICTILIRKTPEVKRTGLALITHPHLVPRLKKE